MTISIWWFTLVVVVVILALICLQVEYRKRRAVESDLRLLSTRPLTAKELAAQKRVSVSTVARLAREGKIKAEKVGRQWRIAQGGE